MRLMNYVLIIIGNGRASRRHRTTHCTAGPTVVADRLRLAVGRGRAHRHRPLVTRAVKWPAGPRSAAVRARARLPACSYRFDRRRRRCASVVGRASSGACVYTGICTCAEYTRACAPTRTPAHTYYSDIAIIIRVCITCALVADKRYDRARDSTICWRKMFLRIYYKK